jgi:DNA-directed RNA polymerase subunit E'/Rpb7
MTTIQKSKYSKFVNESEARDDTIYSKSLITHRVILKIVHIGNNIKQTLEKSIAAQMEGKCIIDGYVKPNSVSVLTYSSGVVRSSDIEFQVVFECLVCSPVEGMIFSCIAKNITKAGIRAEINEDPSPMVIFIARDHHYKSNYFSNVKENDTIRVKVIGQRYELNDKYVSVIAELITMNTALAPASLVNAPLRLPAAASLAPANVPIAAASLAPASLVPASLVPASLVPASLVPASLVPASLVPASLAASIANVPATASLALDENTTMTLAPPSSQIKKRTLKNVGSKKKLNIID